MKRLLQCLRSRGISASCRGMNWATETFVSASGEITISDRFGWWLEAQFSRAFDVFWDGSDEEIESALRDECPRKYMSDRQRAALREELSRVQMPTIGALQIGNSVALRLVDGRVKRDSSIWHYPVYQLFDEFFCSDCDTELPVEQIANICADCRALHPEMLLMDRAA